MAKRGQFVWYELMSTDPKGAQKFYGDVVGWGTAPWQNSTGMEYTMWTQGESMVGGVMELPEEARKGGAPSHWIGYVAVPDVDETAKKARELGGKVMHGPEDIPEVGRFAVLSDPQGAVFCAFKGLQDMPGEDGQPKSGHVSWHELATTDHEAAFEFYSELFGWEKQQAMDMGDGFVYQMYGLGENMLGGMYNKPAEQPGPPAWLYYTVVDDLDGAVAKVKKDGGQVIVDPMEVPGGSRVAVGLDPQGAAFGLHELAQS